MQYDRLDVRGRMLRPALKRVAMPVEIDDWPYALNQRPQRVCFGTTDLIVTIEQPVKIYLVGIAAVVSVHESIGVHYRHDVNVEDVSQAFTLRRRQIFHDCFGREGIGLRWVNA